MTSRAFSASDAAYSGFRLIRDKPQTLLAWTGLQVGFIICWITVNVLLLAPSAQRLRALNELVQADPGLGLAQAPGVLASLLPLLLIDVPLFLVFSGVQNAAILRAHLNPAEDRWSYLRLGRAELNVALAPVVYWLLGFAYLFVVLFVANGIQGLGGAFAGSQSALIGYGLVALLAVALVYPAVRLSLALPLTLAEGRIRILKSWRLTRGHFWSLLSAYVLTTIYLSLVGLVALILFAVLSWVISRALGGSGADAWRTGEAPIIAQALTALISLPFDGLLLAASFAIWRGPSAEAYLAFRDDAPTQF